MSSGPVFLDVPAGNSAFHLMSRRKLPVWPFAVRGPADVAQGIGPARARRSTMPSVNKILVVDDDKVSLTRYRPCLEIFRIPYRNSLQWT